MRSRSATATSTRRRRMTTRRRSGASCATAAVIVDQVECHAHPHQETLGAIAEREGALIAAYAPLGSGGSLLGDPVLEEIAGAHEATPAQVALAWLVGQDRVLALPRSTDPG